MAVESATKTRSWERPSINGYRFEMKGKATKKRRKRRERERKRIGFFKGKKERRGDKGLVVLRACADCNSSRKQ